MFIPPVINFSVPEYTVSSLPPDFNWDEFLEFGFEQNQTFILTSHLPHDSRSEKDIVALNPLIHFTVFIDRIEITDQDGKTHNLTTSPLRFLEEICIKKSNTGLDAGGVFLAFTYEFSALIEPNKKITKKIDNTTPLLFGMIPSSILIRDIHSGEVKLISCTENFTFSKTNSSANTKPELLEFQSLLSDHEFIQTVNKLKSNIFNGDTYEINFAYQTNGKLSVRNDFSIWKSLIQHSPSSFFSYFRNGDRSLISSSPERFFKCDQEKLKVQPMKGTRKRDPLQPSETIINELRNNEKDRAENLMIVDLMRNDLSKIARLGSVKVESLFEVESYKTVYQMISTVTCEIKPNTSFSDIIISLFPPGSMTGAPKIKTMEIIAETEQFKRGFYSGICGYFSFGGTSEFSVLIRCLELSGLDFKANFGGAIVADSIAENELEETKIKMMGIITALKENQGKT